MELKEETIQQAVFQVSLKVLLRDGDKVLITIGDKGDIDLPGGRIDLAETKAPLVDIIAREIREELGGDVKFRLGVPLFVNRSFSPAFNQHVFIVVFDAAYLSGEITLSDEHTSYEWVERDTYQVKRESFLEKDDEKYESFKQYFESLARS